MIKKTLFTTVIYRGAVGAMYGIVIGLILGLLIWALAQTATMISSSAIQTRNGTSMPVEMYITLGMGFAAILGGVFGALTALKEEKK
jgi:cell division protein FtsX